ncbi:cilia- and flagella-associated protein 69-like [Ruditapes philippinarum]|uniref:cilia- and flagella-associated protein 69-like n=1 Tax=Ruditapes philippinarum TaxID=129788 RepID=UPI00295A8E15|nr:cilia- and flagella-associated protein 69-like [Ruditapes philippinarum]
MAALQTMQTEKFATSTGMMESKPTVPVVTHVITDEDIGALQGSKLVAMNLNRVVKLLTDPHSAMLYDRHVNALQRLLRHYPKGFPMKDLVQVFKILNVCADRVNEQPRYEQFIVDILKICSLPFLKEKSSDELIYEQIVIESISQLGYLMRVVSVEVRKQICDTLLAFYSETPANQEVQYHKASTIQYNQKVVENSDIAETLVKSLTLLETDLPVKLAVLNVLQKFSKTSAKICEAMLRADAAHRICSRLMDVDPSGQLLFRSSDILWNLLEKGDQATLTSQLNNLTCISQLRDAFIYQLTQGYSHYDRQLRNDLLVLASIVASKCPDAPFVETGFAKQLVLFATFQEVKSHNALVKHLKLMQNHEDFELKKMLFNIMVTLSKESTVLPILSEGHLMLALFSFVRANESQSGPREWTPAQFEELQLQAMSCLCALCPKMLEDYMTVQGSTRILLLLEWCVGAEDFGGHGNSIHGVGGRGNKRAQMRYCLRVLRSVVSTGDELALQDLADQGAINQIISMCAIVGCYATEDYFLEKEGVFLLIDLLQQCPKGMDNLILGCLLDLCENPKTVHHVLTWRGHENISAAHLFCEIWRNEEREIGVKRDPNGAISDVRRPLMGKLQEGQGVIPLPANCMSQAIVDVSENMRAKIYSLYCKIGFTDLPGLTVEDHITLTVIEKYLDFKMGEVWTEILSELDQEKVRPTTPDMEAVEAISRAIENRAEIVAGTQQELLEAQQSQDVLNEQEFYAEIRENYRQKEKQLNDFSDYVARTSNYELLKAAKERQDYSVEASRIPNEYKTSDFFHETDVPNLKTTAFSSRNVTIDSTPLELTGGPLSKYDPMTGTRKVRRVNKQPA